MTKLRRPLYKTPKLDVPTLEYVLCMLEEKRAHYQEMSLIEKREEVRERYAIRAIDMITLHMEIRGLIEKQGE